MAIIEGLPQEEAQEPQVEEIPEGTWDAWYRSYQKFTSERVYTRDEFFDEISYQFRGVPYRPRPSRAGLGRIPGAGPAIPGVPAFPNIAPDTSDTFMERIEQGLIAKFRPEARQETTYRAKREMERREGQVKDYHVRAMSKEDFLEDLSNQIASVPWKEKNSVHKSAISRPGLRSELQRELKDGSY